MHAVDQVGTVPAALTTYLAVQEFKPDLIVRCTGVWLCRPTPLPRRFLMQWRCLLRHAVFLLLHLYPWMA